MRGRYYPLDFPHAIDPNGRPFESDHRDCTQEPVARTVESVEDRNQRANELKQAAGDGPQIIVSPETPASGADIRAIVRAVALRILECELDYLDFEELRDEYYPELAGITDEQIRAVVREDLS